MSTRLLIDTDPGVDDALAILMAHADPMCSVEALTITAGNVGLQHTTRNAMKLLEVIGAHTPVFVGAGTPLVYAADDAAFVHGKDGFGDIGYDDPIRQPETEHAANAMIRLAKANPGALTFLMMGPLTNLALALSLEPALPNLVKRLVIMGGAVTGRGNTRLIPAEFNISFDPEAAAIVFERWPQFEIADWEATIAHGVQYDAAKQWFESGAPSGAFYRAIQGKRLEFMQSIGRGEWFLAADALAMAVTLHPEHVTQWAERHVAIETRGEWTRGATVVDWDQRNKKPANVKIALKYDQTQFELQMKKALAI